MRKAKLVIFSIILLAILVIPNAVNAANEVSELRIIMEEPVEGAVPASKIKVNTVPPEAVVKEEFEITWEESIDGGTYTTMTTATFESGKYYRPLLEEVPIKPEYNITGTTKAYINNKEVLSDGSFAVGGIELLEINVKNPIVGQIPSATAKITATPADVLKKDTVNIMWFSSEDTNVWESMWPTDRFEVGKYYSFEIIDTASQYMTDKYVIEDSAAVQSIFQDYRTIYKVNGKDELVHRYMFGPLEYKVTKTLTNITSDGKSSILGSDYTATLTANSGYRLPESILVKVDGKELDTNMYTYDNTTGNLVILENIITGNIEIVAVAEKLPQDEEKTNLGDINTGEGQKENDSTEDIISEQKPVDSNTGKESVNNPKTGDNILLYVGILVVSVIGIFTTTKFRKNAKNI